MNESQGKIHETQHYPKLHTDRAYLLNDRGRRRCRRGVVVARLELGLAGHDEPLVLEQIRPGRRYLGGARRLPPPRRVTFYQK